MATITLTIPNGKEQRLIDAMKGINPIPTDEAGDPLFTDKAWAKEIIRRFTVDQVASWEKKVSVEAITESDIDMHIT